MKIIIDIPENVYKGAKLLESYADSVVQIPLEVIAKALPFEEFANKLTNDIYKFASDSFDAECAECYRIALRCIEGHLKEVSE